MPDLGRSFEMAGGLTLTASKETGGLSCEDGRKLTWLVFSLLIICFLVSQAQGQYCSASGGCSSIPGSLNIDSVEVGDISNTGTGCSGGYADYTSMSTTMEIGTGYEITVTNGDPYDESDQCGIWVDWNQDGDFYDAGETIPVSGGTVIFTATITPPAGAALGDTRMRVRIRWTGTLNPCGHTDWGEVEDYTINVASTPPTFKISGHIRLSDDSPLSGVLVTSSPGGVTDISDANGYYEIILTGPWTGHLDRYKEGWVFTLGRYYIDVTTDQIENMVAYWPYSGGIGISGAPYLIATAEDMNAIGAHPEDWDKHFVLTNDIDLAGTTHTKAIIASSQYTPPFSGQFDGAGFSVLNLQSNNGLFGYIKNAVIKNLGIENVEITNAGIAGPLCSSNHGGTIENCFSTGNISGFYDVGGLCAWVHTEYLGEYPPGEPLPPVNTPVIKNCYSTVNVTLVHPHSLPEFSTGSAGGLCAYAEGAELFNNYACGSVDATGCDTPFGFDIVIDNGGLVGHIKNCNVYNNYSSGHVVDGRAYSNPGGFCGAISGDQTNFVGNFWDNTVNPSLQGIGNAADPNVIGESTVIMQMEITFTDAGWNFVDVWKICEGTNYPKLAWQIPLPGDFVCPDGVNFVDFAVLGSAWMSSTNDDNWNPGCDISDPNDGAIDEADLAVLTENWLVDI